MRPMVAGGFQRMMVDGEFVLRADTSDLLSSAMMALRHIVQHTGAQIVLSSEWRRESVMREAVDAILREHKMPACISWTRTDLERKMGTEDPYQMFLERRAQ